MSVLLRGKCSDRVVVPLIMELPPLPAFHSSSSSSLAAEVGVASAISPIHAFLLFFFLFFFNSACVCLWGMWIKFMLLGIKDFSWGRISFLHLRVPLLVFADECSWKSSSGFSAVKYLQIRTVTCLHSHSAWRLVWCCKWKIAWLGFEIPRIYAWQNQEGLFPAKHRSMRRLFSIGFGISQGHMLLAYPYFAFFIC